MVELVNFMDVPTQPVEPEVKSTFGPSTMVLMELVACVEHPGIDAVKAMV